MSLPFGPLHNFHMFTEAMAVLAGTMAWWRKGTSEEDEMHSRAADIVLDNVSSADNINTIELSTGKNLRDQLTVEQAIELNEERTLRRFNRRN